MVWPYAAANDNPGVERDSGDQDLSFLEPARPRPPLHGLGRDLCRAVPGPPGEPAAAGAAGTQPIPDFRPMIDDYSGGDTTCFFARP